MKLCGYIEDIEGSGRILGESVNDCGQGGQRIVKFPIEINESGGYIAGHDYSLIQV